MSQFHVESSIDRVMTGYFGRATENGHRGCVSESHFVRSIDRRPLCKYRPHKTMAFQWCANMPVINYVQCRGCLAKIAKMIKEREHELAKKHDAIRDKLFLRKS